MNAHVEERWRVEPRTVASIPPAIEQWAEGSNCSSLSGCVVTERGELICDLEASGKAGYSLVIANQRAHLISAAPEMLEALHILLSWVEGQKLAGVLPKGWDFRYVEAAVAKAEGRS